MAIVQLFPSEKPKRNLFEFPTIKAKSPNDQDAEIDLVVSESTIEKLKVGHRRSQIFEGWGHLVGEMPPINNAELMRRTQHSEKEIKTLLEADACFCGVNRQYDHDEKGCDVFVYVISTPFTLRWQSKMDCLVNVVETPTDSLLTVQVRSADSLQPSREGVWGTITKWEFISADTEEKRFPRNFETRYDKLLWYK